MKVVRTVASARSWRKGAGHPVVLVPTMGALHRGHGALLRRARTLAGKQGAVIVSIFVNPAQFGPGEDFSRYPRMENEDRALCRAQGVDIVFAPRAEEMYPADHSVFIDEGCLSKSLCGASRPGHFRGVCTVVGKLFAILRPDAAIFGEKDWQQLAIIRRMVRDLNFPVRIVGHPTVREADGLAMSSRNAYLAPGERAVAPGIYAGLRQAAGEAGRSAILRKGRRFIEKIPGTRIDYLELVDAETLEPSRDLRSAARLVAAVFLGGTRLIDNVPVSAKK